MGYFNLEIAKNVLALAKAELTGLGPENGVGYTLPEGDYHIFLYLDKIDDKRVFVLEPNRVEDGAHVPIGGDTYVAPCGDLPEFVLGCLWCLDQFEADRQHPERVWISVYKDTLGYEDDYDNMAEIQVPKQWLKAALRAEGVTNYEQWLNEYTADETEGLAARALAEKVIQGCTGVDVLQTGCKVEWQHSLFEVVGIYDGLVHLQHLSNDVHAEIGIQRFLKDADLVSEAQISKGPLDAQIAAAEAVGARSEGVSRETGREFNRE